MPPLRPLFRPLQARFLSTPASKPHRHLLSISSLTPTELINLVDNATAYRISRLPTSWHLRSALSRRLVAIIYSRGLSRGRVSTEGAVVAMGGHPIFLYQDDIQLGVNEGLYDTSVIISSMVSGIVASAGSHLDIVNLAKYSSVPLINAQSDTYHPLQNIADFATLTQAFSTTADKLGGVRIAWVGDANNVLFDMCIGARKLGIDMAVATPKGHEIPLDVKKVIDEAGQGRLLETNTPEEAVKGANVIITNSWVPIGREGDKSKRLKRFTGYQITEELAKKGGAASDWKFMHSLPRYPEEVSDEVFYGKRSLVFSEAENRVWAAAAALEGFVVNKGEIKSLDSDLNPWSM